MTGNATHRFTNTTALTVCALDASEVVTSAALDERLAETYQRVGLRPGLLERLAGIRERRWWPEGVSLVDGAATAGAGEAGHHHGQRHQRQTHQDPGQLRGAGDAPVVHRRQS